MINSFSFSYIAGKAMDGRFKMALLHALLSYSRYSHASCHISTTSRAICSLGLLLDVENVSERSRDPRMSLSGYCHNYDLLYFCDYLMMRLLVPSQPEDWRTDPNSLPYQSKTDRYQRQAIPYLDLEMMETRMLPRSNGDGL